jgi:hypothetical protein
VALTSLSRSPAPWYPAAGWAWFASIVVLVGAGASHGFDAGVRGAVAVFLAWAIVRELAPKRWLASLLAPFAAVAFAIPAETDLLACFGVLLVARIALRSVGDPPTLLDCAILVALSGALALRPVGLPVAIVLAAIMWADAPPLRTRVAGLVALAAALVVGSTEGTLTLRPDWDDPAMGAQVLLAILGAAMLVLVAWPLPRRLAVACDRRRGGKLQGVRLRSSRLAAVSCVLAGIAWTGTDGVFELSAASAAIVAASLGGRGARAAGPGAVSDTLPELDSKQRAERGAGRQT